MKHKCAVIFMAVSVAFAPAARAETPPYQLWVSQLGSSAEEQAYEVAVGDDGNCYISGFTTGGLSGANQGGRDAFVASFDGVGSHRWTRQFGAGGDDFAASVSVDAAGNCWAGGYVTGSIGGPYLGQTDAFIRQYNSAGVEQWTQQFGTPQYDNVGDIQMLGGEVRISGATDGNFPGPNQGGRDAYVAEVDQSGVIQWSTQVGSPATEGQFEVTMGSDGSSTIVGRTDGNFAAPNMGSSDGFVAHFDGNGVEQWRRQFGSSGWEYARSIATDAAGNVYIAGSTTGNFAGAHLGALYDAFVIKYDVNGVEQWRRQFGTSEWDEARDIVVDAAGNCYLTGYTRGDLGGPNQGDFDVFVTMFDSAGVQQWAWQTGTSLRDSAFGITMGGDNLWYVVGRTQGDLGGVNMGSEDAFVLALVPEPATVGMLALGAAAMLRRRR